MQHGSTCMKGASKQTEMKNGGKRSLHLARAGMMLVLSIAILVLVESAETAGTNMQRRGFKSNERGFKSSMLSTARGFGKRAFRSSLLSTARGFGKRAFKSSLLSTARGFGKRAQPENIYQDEIASLDALPSNQQYEVASLMRQLNEEASTNPRFIPRLLEYIDANADANAASQDDETVYGEP